MSVKVFWISTFAWQYCHSELDAVWSFFTWFCCVVCLGVCFCHLISAIGMQIEATPGDRSWKCPTYPQSCVSERFLLLLGRWGFFSNVTAGKNSLSPCHFNSTLQRVVVQSVPLLMRSCPTPFSLLALRCYTGPTRAGKSPPLYLFPFRRKNTFLIWVEGEWVVLPGWLGNTAFM